MAALLARGRPCCPAGGHSGGAASKAPRTQTFGPPRPAFGLAARRGATTLRASAAGTESRVGAGTALPPATCDTWLGEQLLNSVPEPLYYAPAFVFPLATVAAAVGAIYAAPALAWVAALPLLQPLGPVAPLLHTVATVQPWTALLSVAVSLLTAYWGFLVVPLLDVILGRDLRNPPEEPEAAKGGAAASRGTAGAARAAAGDGGFRRVLYAYVPCHYMVLLGVCHLLSAHAATMHPLAFAGVTASMGVCGGILFTVAHELLHGTHRLDLLLANVLLASVGYMHWTRSHLAHHVKVATPEDPASARRGESLYAFIPRSVAGNLADGVAWEQKRMRAQSIPALSPRNRMLWWAACPAALLAAGHAAFGPAGAAFLVGQAAVSILMLEAVNYVEHYGLERRRDGGGRYEKVAPRHSWNASWLFTNAVAFRLQRHSDHHAFARRPYHMLRNVEEAPQLPACYPAMVVLACVPPLYRRVMTPLLERYAVPA